MSDVSRQYQSLGEALRERQQQLSAMLEKMQEVQEEASSMLKWLESKERTLSELDASSSPTKTETMRAQAEHNKVTSLPEQSTAELSFCPPEVLRAVLCCSRARRSRRICSGLKTGFAQEGREEQEPMNSARPLCF